MIIIIGILEESSSLNFIIAGFFQLEYVTLQHKNNIWRNAKINIKNTGIMMKYTRHIMNN